jgi:hypothetical protein
MCAFLNLFLSQHAEVPVRGVNSTLGAFLGFIMGFCTAFATIKSMQHPSVMRR